MKTSPAQQHLADALTVLKKLQDNGKSVIKSNELKRIQLSSLVKNGFLKQILKGWYMPSRPDEQGGDSTPWFAAMRDFIAGYCTERFGDNWHVSPDLSLSLHAGSTYPLRNRYGMVPHSIIRASLPALYRLDTELGKESTMAFVRLVENGFFNKAENTEIQTMTAADYFLYFFVVSTRGGLI